MAEGRERERTDDAGARHPSVPSARYPDNRYPRAQRLDDPDREPSPDHPAALARFVAQRPARSIPGYSAPATPDPTPDPQASVDAARAAWGAAPGRRGVARITHHTPATRPEPEPSSFAASQTSDYPSAAVPGSVPRAVSNAATAPNPVSAAVPNSAAVPVSVHEPERRTLAGMAASEFGLLAPLISDPHITDVFVNGADGVWVDRGIGLTRAPGFFPSERELRALAVRLVSLGGRHIDEASPCIDARLDDGIRVHAVLPPISTNGTLLSVRLPSVEIATIERLDAGGFFDLISRDTVTELVARRENILITGAGGSGKTTLLCALLGSASPAERIIAIEDVAELRVAHPHFLSLEARQPNLEGAGALGLERLVREALRMRPDRLVLGECRGAEIREMLAALNTGHDGGASTLHANSLEDVPARLEALGALAGMSPVAIARQTVSAIGTVLHLERATALGGERRLAQMGSFALDHRDRLTVVPRGAAPRRGAHAAAAS